MASRLQDVILRGLAAARPAIATVAPGTLYYSTDLQITERADDNIPPTAWEDYTDAGGVAADAFVHPFLLMGG